MKTTQPENTGLTKLKTLSIAVAVAVAVACSGQAFADNVLSTIDLTEDNSEIKLLYSDHTSLGRVAFSSSSFTEALNFLSSNPTSATEGDFSYSYKYVTVAFPTTVTGTYTFGQSSAPSDTFLIVYDGSFNPEDMTENFYSANDDISSGWNSGATVPPGITLDACGSSSSRCPVLETTLSADSTYTLFLSHFSTSGIDSFALPLGIFVYGPEGVTFVTTGLKVYDATVEQQNSPGYNAASIIDATSELLELFVTEGVSGSQNISNAVTETLPLLTGGGYFAAQSALHGINNSVKARQAKNLGLSSGDEMLRDQHFWAKPFGTWTKQDDRNNVAGFDAKTGGLILGLDAELNEQTRLGLAFAYASSNVDGNSSIAAHYLDVQTYQLVGYGSRTLDANTDLTFQADIGQNQNKGKRIITFASSVAESDYDSRSVHLGMGVTRSYSISETNRAIATITADYTWLKEDSYSESGAGVLNLSVDTNSTEAFIVGLEGELIHSLGNNTELTVSLGAGYDLINEDASITSAYAAAPAAQFTTNGIDPGPWLGTAGIGIHHTAANGVEVSVNYDAEYRSDYLSQTAALKLRWAF